MPAEKGPVFRKYDPKQTLLLAPSLDDWLPDVHLARFISELVDHEIDLAPFVEGYENQDGGNPAFHPALMLKIWLYGYCVGTVSSRRVARATYEDVAFRFLAANQHPTFTPLARFRERNLVHMDRLFLDVLRLCQEAGLVGMARLALDGTKVKANASKHKAMSHGKMLEKEQQLDDELRRSIQEYLRKGIEIDQEEDRKFGKENNPYLHELPEGWRTAKERLERIRAARKRLEEREKAKAQAAGKDDTPIDPKAQINFTDPDSRIMPDGANRGSFVQAYNCQAMVDEKAQIIVAAEVTQDPTDKRQMVPMVNATIRNTEMIPRELDADAGFFGEAAIHEAEERGIDVYCPPDNGRTTERAACARGRPPEDETFVEKMRRKVRSENGRAH
ncbi:MAG: IS1182 family transposase, partial [Thermoplasmata archaeon]